MRTREVFGGAWGPSITLDFSEDFCTIIYKMDDINLPLTLDRDDLRDIVDLLKAFLKE